MDKININLAGVEELTKLHGIDKKLAKRIIRYREKNGFFNNIDDLTAVNRISKNMVDQLKCQLILENGDEIQNLKAVICDENLYIRERRNAVPHMPSDQRKYPLIGLAFSGGGIRSAAFNLGLVQALSKYKILPWVDYFSSISGGGYLATCLSSFLSWPHPDDPSEFLFQTKWEKFPFNPELDIFKNSKQNPKDAKSPDEKTPIREEHLSKENGANDANGAWTKNWQNKQLTYLIHKGNFLVPRLGTFTRDTLRLFGAYLRGFTSTVLIYLLALFAISAIFYGTVATIASDIMGQITLPLEKSTEIAVENGAEEKTSPTTITVTFQTDVMDDGIVLSQLITPTAQINTDTSTKYRYERSDIMELLFEWESVRGLYAITFVIGFIFGVGFRYWIVFFLKRSKRNRADKADNVPSHIPNRTPEESNHNQFFSRLNISFFVIIICLTLTLKLPKVYDLIGNIHNWFDVEISSEKPHIFWLWIPLIWIIGHRLALFIFTFSITTTRNPEKLKPWSEPEFRTVFWAWYSITMYFLIGMVMLIVFSLPFFFSLQTVDASNTAITTGLATTLISAAWGVYLAKKSDQESKLQQLLKIPPAFQKILLGLLVVILNLSLLFLFTNLIDYLVWVQTVKSISITSKVIYIIIGVIGVWGLFIRVALYLKKRSDAHGDEKPFSKTNAVAIVLVFALLILEALSNPFDFRKLGIYLLAFGAVGGIFILERFINYNYASLHYFYRDRLAEAFLKTEVKSKGKNGVPWRQPVRDSSQSPLTDLNPENCPAPYHLIVAAINLGGSKDLSVKDWKSQHFIFSGKYCGSEITGYVDSGAYRSGLTKLSRAMTLSAAAVSPSIGPFTFFAQAFMLTLINARLGLWMTNPSRHQPSKNKEVENKDIELEQRGGWATYLWDELRGQPSEKRDLVLISDGGHTGDNTAIYPLLQRKCKLIIAGDASQDNNFSCRDLFRAIHQAKSDGYIVDADIDISTLKPAKAKDGELSYGRFHYAIGEITYTPDGEGKKKETGWLIYYKPVMTKADPGLIKQYAETHDTNFPHVTTADQFFDEEQFEAYRQLGEVSVKQSLKPFIKKKSRLCLNLKDEDVAIGDKIHTILQKKGGYEKFANRLKDEATAKDTIQKVKLV